MTIFAEISLILAITTVVTIFARLLKQPLVVGYIFAGILVGPSVLNILTAQHELEIFAKVGIVFLLFIVGLQLNPTIIKEVGKVSLVTGLGQVIFTSIIGFGIALFLGLDRLAALYVAIAITFSSTIIILKLLADKKDLQKLYAKISIGFLLVQDIVATIILIGVTVFASNQDGSILESIGLTLLKGFVVLFALLVISIKIFPRFLSYIAKSQELLFIFSLSWATGLASLFVYLGFSIEIGALMAGVTLASIPYATEMASRLKPIRDFFIVIFFILLGSQLMIDNLGAIIIPAIIFSLFVLIGNPIIVVILMNLLGFNKRTGFLAGLTVAQISEFSLILASLGLRVGHLSQETLSLITLVGLITIAGSTYLILYSNKIYPYVAHLLNYLELVKKTKKASGSIGENYENLIFGYDRVGKYFAETFAKLDSPFLVVDFNPESIKKLEEAKISYRYGDADDPEFLEELPVTKPRLVVSTIPETNDNLMLLKYLLDKNKKVIFIPIAHTVKEANKLYAAGAAYVIMPHHLGAEFAAFLIEKHKFDELGYLKEKEKHLKKIDKNFT